MTARTAPRDRRADAARLVGAIALMELGLVAVDAPGGPLGPGDTLSGFGLVFGVAVAAATAVAAIGRLRGWTAAEILSPIVLASAIGPFVPALSTDPVLAGIVVGWLLYRLLRELLPVRAVRVRRAGRDDRDPISRWNSHTGRAFRHLAATAIVLTVLAAGYGIGDRIPAYTVCLAAHALALATWLRLGLLALRSGSRWPLVSAGLLAAAVPAASIPSLGLVLLAASHLPALVSSTSGSPLVTDIVEFFFDSPAALVASSFGVLIGLGTLLLSFPIATPGPDALRPVDALFTATSAACVTGLIVVDTGTALSGFGQAVVLALIQAGGLSIMVLSTFAAMLLGQRIGLRGELALGEVLDQESRRSALQLVRFVVVATLAVEAAAGVALATERIAAGAGVARGAWWGAFHAVSAFCNAGFALQAESLAGYVRTPWVLLLVAGLITVGGVGFPVLLALWSRASGRHRRPLDLHTRIVVVASAVLVAGGAVWLAAAEASRSLADLAPLDLTVNAVFQSVTLRTAGFNSVDLTTMAPATVLLMMVFMFVGASPGGTGGGIKTTTAVVLLGAVPSILRRRSRVVIANRTVPLETVFRSAAIAVIAVLVVVGGSLVLLASQDLPFDVVVFEAFSAFGTVGLSLGATPELDALGRVVVAVLMFAGRIGPLTLALLLGRGRRSRVGYPETRIMVG